MDRSQRKISIASQIYALDAQSILFDNLVLDVIQRLDLSDDNNKNIIMILAGHGKGLMREADILSKNPLCDQELMAWIKGIHGRIQLYYLIMQDEYLNAIGNACTEEEFDAQAEEYIADYSNKYPSTESEG